MSYLSCNRIKDFVVDEIIDKLNQCNVAEGLEESHYGSVLAYNLFSCERGSEAYFMDNEEASKWIDKYRRYISEVMEEISFTTDKNFLNDILIKSFDYPDYLIMFIVCEVAEALLSHCKTIQDNWDNEIVLTEEVIEKLIEELKEI